MTDGKYFLRLGGAFLLGMAALVIAGIIFFISLPFLLPLALGTLLLIIVFIAIWATVYVCVMIGVGIYYFFKHPTKWEKKDKGYTIAKAKESGRRQKGKSKK